MPESLKVSCTNCGWQGEQDQMLVFPDPTDADADLNLCPQCKFIATSIQIICDEPGCWNPVSTGWMDTEKGTYRLTCYEHMAKEAILQAEEDAVDE